jgi:hypothetical protein
VTIKEVNPENPSQSIAEAVIEAELIARGEYTLTMEE